MGMDMGTVPIVDSHGNDFRIFYSDNNDCSV